jgi:VCBS repeat-containing protein
VVEDTALSASGQVTAEDIDNGAVLSYTGDATGTYGSFVVDPDTGEWTYTLANAAHQNLAEGESHDEMFDVTVTDQWGLTSYQTVTIHVVGTNDDPELTEVQADLANGSEDVSYVVTLADLLQGFSDIDTGDVLAIANLSADHGNVTDNLDGTFTIVPAANYHGPVVLSYNVVDDHGGSLPATLSFELAAVQDLTAQDDSFSGDEDQPISGSVAGNDSTTSGGLLSYVVATGPANGSLTFDPDGSFEYTPDGNYNGADSFTYTVTDAASGESDTRTVDLTINAVNDAAVITGVVIGSVTEDALPLPTSVSGDASSTDVDGVNDLWAADSGTSSYGTWSVSGAMRSTTPTLRSTRSMLATCWVTASPSRLPTEPRRPWRSR